MVIYTMWELGWCVALYRRGCPSSVYRASYLSSSGATASAISPDPAVESGSGLMAEAVAPLEDR